MPKGFDEKKHILHGSFMPLETFARSLFGDRYFGSVGWTDPTVWKRFYLDCVEVLQGSFSRSVGSIDGPHRKQVEDELKILHRQLKQAKHKDQMHTVLVVRLFRLVFLLMGRLPYHVRGKRRTLNTFRTLSYSQTEEQLSWLLQGYVQRHAEENGFDDFFHVDHEFFVWAQERKRPLKDRSAYVEWVRERLPEVYAQFR